MEEAALSPGKQRGISKGGMYGISLLDKFKEWASNWHIFPKHFPTLEPQFCHAEITEGYQHHSPNTAHLSSTLWEGSHGMVHNETWKGEGEKQGWVQKVAVKDHEDKQNILTHCARGGMG